METGSDFETIFKSYKPKIHRYITRLIGACEAEDLTQEVFVKISQGLQNFNQKSQISTWIYRIATNAAIDRLRSASFKQAKNIIPEDELIAEDKAVGTDKKVLECHGDFYHTEESQLACEPIKTTPTFK